MVSTPLYPEWPIVKLQGVSEETAHRVAEALIAMPSDHAAARAGKIVGWSEPLNYGPVKALQQTLKIGSAEE